MSEFPWAQSSSFENIYTSEQQQQQQKHQSLSSDTVDANLDATFEGKYYHCL